MPHFYFHLYNDVTLLDDEGVEMCDIEEAKQHAYLAAAQLIAERVKSRELLDPDYHIDVANAEGRVVFTLRCGDLMKRKG